MRAGTCVRGTITIFTRNSSATGDAMDDVVARSVALNLDPVDLNDAKAVSTRIVQTLIAVIGRDPGYAQPRDWYTAVVYFLRGILGQRMARMRRRAHETQVKRVYYLSLEYLPGRMLPKALTDLGLEPVMRQALGAL